MSMYTSFKPIGIRSTLYVVYDRFRLKIHTQTYKTTKALGIHSDFVSRFEVSDTPCRAEVTLNETCMWGCKTSSVECLNMSPQGPHTFGSVGFSMPNSEYNTIVPWVFSAFEKYGDRIAGILIHPLTAPRGNDTLISRRKDHELGLWIPERLTIDYDFLNHNVYDCDVCDVNNCTQAC